MEERRLGYIRLVPRSINSRVFLLCMYFMIIMTVFNGNKYVAGLSFVWLPSILLLAASLVMEKNFINRINVYAILLACSAVLSTSLATVDIKKTTCINLLFCIISFIFITSVKLNDDDFSAILHFYMSFSFIVCLVLIFNYIFSIGVQTFSAGNVRVSIKYFGIYKDGNYLSSFVVPCFAYYLYKGLFARDTFSVFKAGIVFVSIFIAGSRACFLAMMLSSFIIVIKMIFDRNHSVNKPLIVILLLMVVIILYSIVSRSEIFERTTNFENYSNNARLTIWSYALNGFFANPFIGSGVEAGSYYSLLGTKWKTHNCFIDILTGQGIIGTVLVIMMYADLLKVKKENRAFLTAIVSCFFVPLFFLNGYECATFWMPMMLVKFISDKCKEYDDILNIVL